MKFHYTTTKTMLSREQSALKSWHTHTHTLSHLLTCCHLAHYSRRQLPTQRVRHTYKWRWQGKNRHPLISKRTSVDACVQMEPPNTPRSQPNERTNERTNARTKEENNSKQTQKLNESRRTTDGRRATQRTHSRREQEDTFSFGESHCIHSLVLLPLLVFLIQSSATATDVRPTLTQSRHIEMQLHIFIKM